jgi:pyruvate/2-oxoglutarate/acetoin dehydrogenase E1 component
MVIFEDDAERDYFNERMMIGEVSRATMAKIISQLEKSQSITKEELFVLQEEAINELREEVKKLEAEEQSLPINNEENKTESTKE